MVSEGGCLNSISVLRAEIYFHDRGSYFANISLLLLSSCSHNHSATKTEILYRSVMQSQIFMWSLRGNFLDGQYNIYKPEMTEIDTHPCDVTV